jgi:hypothetical protein
MSYFFVSYHLIARYSDLQDDMDTIDEDNSGT